MALDLGQLWLLMIAFIVFAGVFRYLGSISEREKEARERRRLKAFLSRSIREIEGIGAKEAVLLRLAGIKTLGDLLDADLEATSRKIKIQKERLGEWRSHVEKLISK